MSRLLTSLQRIASQGPLPNEPPVVVPQANVNSPEPHGATATSKTTPSSTLARLNALQELMAAEWGSLPDTPVAPAPLPAPLESASTSSVPSQITATPKPSASDATARPAQLTDESPPATGAQELSWQSVASVETVAPDREFLAESSLVEAVEVIDATLSGFWNVEVSSPLYPSLANTASIDDSTQTDFAAPPAPPFAPPPQVPAVRRSALLKIRDEYAQLRDHLLSQFSLPLPCTILLIDTGPAQDSAWLMPLAISFWQYLVAPFDTSDQTSALGDAPRVLLVESAGSTGAESLGLHSQSGLTDVLLDRAVLFSAVQPTPHPSIDLLTGGNSQLSANMAAGLARVWQELQQRYDIVLVAGGPWHRDEGQRGCDPASLMGLAQAVLLCVDVKSSPRVAAIRAADDLRQRGANLLGCIVRT